MRGVPAAVRAAGGGRGGGVGGEIWRMEWREGEGMYCAHDTLFLILALSLSVCGHGAGAGCLVGVGREEWGVWGAWGVRRGERRTAEVVGSSRRGPCDARTPRAHSPFLPWRASKHPRFSYHCTPWLVHPGKGVGREEAVLVRARAAREEQESREWARQEKGEKTGRTPHAARGLSIIGHRPAPSSAVYGINLDRHGGLGGASAGPMARGRLRVGDSGRQGWWLYMYPARALAHVPLSLAPCGSSRPPNRLAHTPDWIRMSIAWLARRD